MTSICGSYLIVSDIDGTMLGDEAALAALAAWLAPRRERISLAYASGRFLRSVHRSIRSTGLPEPDFVIGGVGTDIFDYRARRRAVDWPAVRAGSWSSGRVREAMAGVPGLREQPAQFQSAWKISYYLDDATDAQLAQIRQRLQQAGLDTDVIYSSRRDLDVLPGGINKGAAALHVARMLGIEPQRVLACGDSGNDLSMYCCGFRGIVVGNAMAELKEGAGEPVYIARGAHAGGVLEGLRHWLA